MINAMRRLYIWHGQSRASVVSSWGNRHVEIDAGVIDVTAINGGTHKACSCLRIRRQFCEQRKCGEVNCAHNTGQQNAAIIPL